VFDPQALPEMFPGLRRASFSYVDDNGGFHTGALPAAAAGSDYACGMYVLVKDA
jgi:hypothetical protein